MLVIMTMAHSLLLLNCQINVFIKTSQEKAEIYQRMAKHTDMLTKPYHSVTDRQSGSQGK